MRIEIKTERDMKTNKKMDRLQGTANTREANGNTARESGNAASARRDERTTQGTKEFEQGKSRETNPTKPKRLGDESEIEDESTI